MSHPPPTHPVPVVQAVHAVPVEPQRPLDPNVAVLTLCLVLQLSGVWRFLLMLCAVLVLDRRINLLALTRRSLDAVRWLGRCLPEPPTLVAAAMAPPDALVLAAQALSELIDTMLEE